MADNRNGSKEKVKPLDRARLVALSRHNWDIAAAARELGVGAGRVRAWMRRRNIVRPKEFPARVGRPRSENALSGNSGYVVG